MSTQKELIKEFENLMKIQGLFTCSCEECIELRKKWRQLKKTLFKAEMK